MALFGYISGQNLGADEVMLRRKAGVSLVSMGKVCASPLAKFLPDISAASSDLISTGNVCPPQKMHLIEFLTCVANAVPGVQERAGFIRSVLAESISVLASEDFIDMTRDVESLFKFIGVASPEKARDQAHVEKVSVSELQPFLSRF